MKKVSILLLNLLFSASVLAQETAMRCKLDGEGGSLSGFVAHGFLTLLFFSLAMNWASRSRAGMKNTEPKATDIREEFKQAA